MTDRLLSFPVTISLLFLGATGLSGCDRLGAAWEGFQLPTAIVTTAPTAPVAPSVAKTTDSAAPTGNTPLTPTGQGAALTPAPDDYLQSAASVVEVHPLDERTGLDGKIFGLAGGDPAMNGLQTYLAVYRSPADGWRVYQIGDFLSFKVLGQSRGQVDLEVEESTLDEATTTIGKRTRRIIVAFTVPPGDGSGEDQPVAVRVIPAA